MKPLLLTLVVAVLSCFGIAASPQKVTVPLTIEDNRLFLDVQFARSVLGLSAFKP